MTTPKLKTKDARTAERKEDLRIRIGASNLLTSIEKTEADVVAIAQGPVVPQTEDEDLRDKAVKSWLATSPIKLQAAKVLLDSQYKRLAKVLPDLKAMELSQDPENPVFTDERALDSVLSRLIGAVATAEGRVAAAPTGEGKVH